jgi:hypothetical protein
MRPPTHPRNIGSSHHAQDVSLTGLAAAAGRACAALGLTGDPQALQNAAPAPLGEPHLEQYTWEGRGATGFVGAASGVLASMVAPQSPQNLAPVSFWAWHFGQFINGS